MSLGVQSRCPWGFNVCAMHDIFFRVSVADSLGFYDQYAAKRAICIIAMMCPFPRRLM